jgi:GT2 family glycosyltransferase
MDLSVIIITRDTRELTANAIRAALAAQGPLALEILVVDNGSSDDTATALPREFPQIQLIRAEKNLGFARAVNRAAQPARGEFLLLLNSDARPAGDGLARAVAWMRANPDCAVAGAQLLNADGSRQNSIANFPTLATELLNKSLLRRLRPGKYPGKEQNLAAPMDVETVVGAFMLIRRKDWDAHGGLDERFFFFFEETDFCLQVRRAGRRVVHLPDVRVWHEQGATARKVSAAARIEYWRSRYAYFKKNSGAGARILLAAGLWLRLLVDGLAALVMVILTAGGSPRWKNKWQVCAALWGWHLRGCPGDAGLPR